MKEINMKKKSLLKNFSEPKEKIGIIAEFNPFHNGHIFLLNKTKELFPQAKICVILAGKYTQRGEINVASFSQRKKIAKKYGASKVIKLPFEYSTQAAHIFAQGAIAIAHKQKITKIIFGSESNNVDVFYKVANYIKKNEKDFFKKIKLIMKQGVSFPKANDIILSEHFGENFNKPNDILGLEYVKALVNNNYNIKAYSIKRTIDFHSIDINETFASATQLRKMIQNNEDISLYSPMKIKKIKKIENHYPTFQKIVFNTSSEKLAKIKMMSEGMENLFKKNISAINYDEFISRVNSKRYTSSRIKRVMLYIILSKKFLYKKKVFK